MLFLWLNKSSPEKVLPLVVKRVFANVIVPIWKKKVFRKQGGGACGPFALSYEFLPFGIKRQNEEI
jgi:hypothetical protein